MASLGAVYGISFVAGSLASMGSAYMASKIYPIEDDVPPIEQPYVDNSPVITSTSAREGGMRGGDRKSDLEDLVKKYDAFVVEAANKNWTEVRKLKRSFVGKAVQLKITDAVEATKALKAAITARTSTPPAKDAKAKETDSTTKLTDLYETIKNELASVPASPAVVISSSVKAVSYTSLAVATDNNLSGFHFARTSDGTKGLVLTSYSDTPIASVTYPFEDKSKFAVTNTYGLKVVSAKDQDTTYNVKVVEVDTKKDTSNIFILTNSEDLPDGKQLAVYGSETLDNWSTPKTPDQNAIKSAKIELENAGVALDTAVKKAIGANASDADIADALPAAIPAAPGDIPVLDFDKRINAAITNAKNPPIAVPPPNAKATALAEIPKVVGVYKTKYSDLKRLTDLKRITIKDDAIKLKGKLDASYASIYKNYLVRGESTVDLASEDKGGPVGIEDGDKFILVGLVTDIDDSKHPIFTTVSQFIPTLKQFPIKLAKYDKVTDKYVYDNVKYSVPFVTAPVPPQQGIEEGEIKKIREWVNIMKEKTLINNDVIPINLIYKFINKEFIFKEGEQDVVYEPPTQFLETYVKYVEENNNNNPRIIVPRLDPDFIRLLISDDPSMTGGQRGGTMADYAGIDIISAIAEIRSIEAYKRRDNTKQKENEFIEKKQKRNAEENARALEAITPDFLRTRTIIAALIKAAADAARGLAAAARGLADPVARYRVDAAANAVNNAAHDPDAAAAVDEAAAAVDEAAAIANDPAAAIANDPAARDVLSSFLERARAIMRAFKSILAKPTGTIDIDTIVGDGHEGGYHGQRGGALDGKLYKIIENGPFVDGKSTITWEVLQKIKNLIIAFYGVFVMPVYPGDYNTELLKINKERSAKILTVQSWLRTVPKKTTISKSYIEKIVPESLSFKQFIDILADMVEIDSKTGKPNIQLTKDVFDNLSDLVSPIYVINEGSPIYKLTRQLDGKIEIKHIIKYFEGGGDLYTFFRFKNVLRVIYDFSFGDKDYDKVFINLSKIITWLSGLNVNKISNKDIEKFKTTNPRTPMTVVVDTLAFLIKKKVQIKNNIIRVTDFNAIETLDEDNVDINTKIIKAVIDPSQITLPKPTALQIQKLETEVGKSPITPDDLILASLFVGSIELPSRPTISGLGDIGITSFSDPSTDGVQTVTFTGSNPSLKTDVRVTITGATESSNNVLNSPILSVSKKTFMIKNKTGVEEDNVTAKATLSRALPPDATSVIGMLDQIQNAIDKRKEANILASMTRSEYKTGETVKQAKAYMKGTESEKERKMIEESLRKDEMIKQLEQTKSKFEEDEKLQAEARAKFDKNLEKLVASNKLKELESLLKERDAELAKDYEKIKVNDNNNNSLVKPPAVTDDNWNKLRTEIGPVRDSLELLPIIEKFKTENPGVDVAPYESVERMIRKIYESKESKKNKGNKSGRSSNTGGTPKCADVGGRAPCIKKDGSLHASGGYHQTLRNHLRSRRFTRRHL